MTVVHHCWSEAYRVGPEGGGADACRVLLVGEDNPQSAKPQHALWPIPSKGSPGCAGRNLQSKILRVAHSTYYGLWRTNLCLPRLVEYEGHGSGEMVPGRWNLDEARRRATILSLRAVPWRTIIMLGRKVAGAFEWATGEAVKQWEWSIVWNDVEDDWIKLVALPHPSGLTRAWNDPASYDRALDLLQRAAPSAPWGELGRIPVADEEG